MKKSYRGLFFVAAMLMLPAAGSVPAIAQASAETIEEGRKLAENRQRGNCYSCHAAEGAELAGNVGPPLVYMKQRYPDRQALYQQIADARIRNPETVMPPYGAHGILSEDELNRVVDYVLSL